MDYRGDGYWQLHVEIQTTDRLDYTYIVQEANQIVREEWGKPHRVFLPAHDTIRCLFNDHWQDAPPTPWFYSQVFQNSLFRQDDAAEDFQPKAGQLLCSVFAPRVEANQYVGIVGSGTALGNWTTPIPMQAGTYPEWTVCLDSRQLGQNPEFQYVICDRSSHRILSWEWGRPHQLWIAQPAEIHVQYYSGLYFRSQQPPWRACGTAIPVFSLRSKRSWGCGDFGDLKTMVQWTAATGQKMLQLLPINDSNLTGTWLDSYPYQCTSIYALNPLYLDMHQLPCLQDTKQSHLLEQQGYALNQKESMDYEAVIHLKMQAARMLFDQEKNHIQTDKDYQRFLDRHRVWLKPYAVFKHLQVQFNSYNTNDWQEFSTYDESIVASIQHPDIEFHYAIQFWLHKQLESAHQYAQQMGIALKGDIPIGIHPNSVEAWTQPQLFRTDCHIGAPPDVFSQSGQNWGFPAYNWEAMQADAYEWWRKRFQHLSTYVDAYRIDHILGFFRIWENPSTAVEGLLGQFQPALPYDANDLKAYGFDLDPSHTLAQFRDAALDALLGVHRSEIQTSYLKQKETGVWQLKTAYRDQRAIQQHVQDPTHRSLLFSLCGEVLFVLDHRNPNRLHPRILASNTQRYKELSHENRQAFDRLYEDFFFHRHTDFWKAKALEKIPALIHSTDMLACGEDLGMIPACVPDVLKQLNILSLEIQRMPKKPGQRFAVLQELPYLAVCCSSSHDLSPLRSWWEEDPAQTQRYFEEVLWQQGKAPETLSPEWAEQILAQHLSAPCMWVINPLQDWMAIDGELRKQDPHSERINQPANPKHYWQYRMHLTLEELIENNDFTEHVRRLITHSGRN